MSTTLSEAKKELLDYIINYPNVSLSLQKNISKCIIHLDISYNNHNFTEPNFIYTLENNMPLSILSKTFYNPFHIQPMKTDKYYKSFLTDLVTYISTEKDQQKYIQKLEFLCYNFTTTNMHPFIFSLSEVIDFIGLEPINKLISEERKNNHKGLIYYSNNYIDKTFFNTLSKKCKKETNESKIQFFEHLITDPYFKKDKKFNDFYFMKFIIKFLNADSKSLEQIEKFFPPIKDYLKNNSSILTIDLFKNNLESIYLDEKVLQSFVFSKNYGGNTNSLLNIINENFNQSTLIKESFQINKLEYIQTLSGINFIIDCVEKEKFNKTKFQNLLLNVINDCIYGNAVSNKNKEIDTYIDKIVLDQLLPQTNAANNLKKIKL